jgi:hypothetical protein
VLQYFYGYYGGDLLVWNLTTKTTLWLMLIGTAPHLRQLGASLPPLQPRFNPRSGHVGFVVDKVALGLVFLQVIQLPLPILIPPTAI